MKQVIDNPFRIIGVLSSASAREMLAVKNKAQKYFTVGQDPELDIDFGFLSTIQRNADVLKAASSSIERSEDRIRHSLFWFSEGNKQDKVAIDYFKKGDLEKAREILNKVVSGREFSEKNISTWNNLSTAMLLDDEQKVIVDGIAIKANLIQSESFSSFIDLVADETASSNHEQYLNFLLEETSDAFVSQFGRQNSKKYF
jgi:hypothetical protein